MLTTLTHRTDTENLFWSELIFLLNDELFILQQVLNVEKIFSDLLVLQTYIQKNTII